MKSALASGNLPKGGAQDVSALLNAARKATLDGIRAGVAMEDGSSVDERLVYESLVSHLRGNIASAESADLSWLLALLPGLEQEETLI
jgi:hypothetical protein